MKGTRPLTKEEVDQVSQKLLQLSKHGQRNQLMFVLGCKTGFRISELLSITVKDVIQHGNVTSRVAVYRRYMKGQIESRSVILVEMVKPMIVSYVAAADLKPDDKLFNISRVEAHRILTKAFDVLRMEGKLACHSLRKTFAQNVYDRLDHDLVKTQKALGHKWISTTAQYISFREEDVDAAVMSA
jgi:site-specific recombinase XerD